MIDKRLVAESFSKAAMSYDRAAHLQRQVGNRLLSLLSGADRPQRIVDLGCGTGYFTRKLKARYPQAEVIGLDIAQGMLKFARAQAEGDGHRDCAWAAGDAEQLPLADGSVDLLFSSLAIQWCSRLADVFRETRRVLKPGGVALFSTLADGTLSELREAWSAVDQHRHVNEFVGAGELRDAVGGAGFQRAAIEVHELVLEYDDLKELMLELKKLGAHNINQDRPSGMTGRQKIKALLQAYERFRTPAGKLPATWQVLFGRLEP